MSKIYKPEADSITNICSKDEAILIYGAKQISKHRNSLHLDNSIRSNMRSLARLLMKLKLDVISLFDCLPAKHLTSLYVAIEQLCNFNSEHKELKNPGILRCVRHTKTVHTF